MFSKDTYIKRRKELKELVGSGVIIIFGNNESPCNFPNNGYAPFRQDSSFLYYFGQNRDGLVGVIDVDNDIETLIGDDIDIEDIVWYGSVDSVHDMAEQGSNEVAEDHLQQRHVEEAQDTLPPSLQMGHQVADIRSARHSS